MPLGYIPEIEGIGGAGTPPGIVHRLDKDTSGLIILAKNDHAHHWLQDQFRTRQVVKTYLALVDGKPPTPNGRVDAPIGRETRAIENEWRSCRPERTGGSIGIFHS